MSRSVMYRYQQTQNKRYKQRIAHLTTILQKLVSLGHTDPELLAELNQIKSELAGNQPEA